MKFKKLLCTVLSVVIGAAMFAACSTGAPEEEVYEDDGHQLLIWSVDPLVGDYATRLEMNANDTKALMTKKIVEDFKAATVSTEHPNGIKVVIKNRGWGTELDKQLQSAILAGTMPDLTVGEQFVKTYINNAHFLPLDGEGGIDSEILNDIIDETKAVTDKNGHTYAVPLWTGSFALNINMAALAKFGILDKQTANGVNTYTVNAAWQAEHPGLNPLKPETWEELLEICQYIYGLNGQTVNGTKLSGIGGMLMSATKDGASWRALPFMRTAGGDIATQDGKTVTVDTTVNKKAFEMMRSFVATAPARSILSNTENSMWNSYLFKDNVAYTVDGSDILSLAAEQKEDRTDDFAVVELPTYEENGKKANVLVGSGYFSISKTTTMKEECIQFLEYMLSPEVQRMIMETDNRLATRKSVLESDETKALPNYKELEVFIAPFLDANEYEFEGGLPTFDNNPASVWEYWQSFIEDVLRTDKELTGLMKTCQSNMSKAAAGK